MLSSTICGRAAMSARSPVVEAVASMAFEAERRGFGGGNPEAAELVVGFGGLAPLPGVAPRPGMELDDRASQFGAGLQRLRRGLDEHRDPNSGPRQFGDVGFQRP